MIIIPSYDKQLPFHIVTVFAKIKISQYFKGNIYMLPLKYWEKLLGSPCIGLNRTQRDPLCSGHSSQFNLTRGLVRTIN